MTGLKDELRYDDELGDDVLDQNRERVKMPVGRHSRARAASKTSWRSRQVSSRHSKSNKGMHHRRNNRSTL